MPPELGAQRKLGGGHAKKISDQKLQRDAWTNIFCHTAVWSLCPQLQNRVGAYGYLFLWLRLG